MTRREVETTMSGGIDDDLVRAFEDESPSRETAAGRRYAKDDGTAAEVTSSRSDLEDEPPSRETAACEDVA